MLLSVLVAATAQADTYVVKGAGNGHGVGMSQYGAYGYAQRGRSYERILAHYYRGTDLGATSGGNVRVLLQASRTPGASFTRAKRIGGEDLNPRRTYDVRPSGGGVEIRSSGGGVVARFPQPVAAKRAGGVRLLGTAINERSNGTYRGELEFRPGASGGITVVNVVGLEDYLRGVVPNESPSSWPADALRAQAVAARSYAIANEVDSPVFDQYPDQRSQVYAGKDSEAPGSDAAVRDTRHQVLLYAGQVASTFFFSASGGQTENVENSFYGDPIPYLKSVNDPYDDASPLHRWTLKFSQSRIESRLSGLFSGNFRGIRVLERGVSPRIVTAKVRGSRGSSVVSGATLRARLDLYDTWARFKERGSSSGAASTAPAAAPPEFGSISPPLESLQAQP